MRHGRFWAVLAVWAVASCAPSKPLKDMVGYVPPTSLPAQPKRTLVADRQAEVWGQLVDFLETSSFEIDHIDEEKNLLVARYSGDPEPYIDCGSIVTHQGGALGQIAGSASAVALNYEIEKQPVVLNRTLNLDSRIIIRLADQPQGTVIETDTTYVVTKIVDVADPSGAIREGSRETISFEAGGRGEFSKGTACQPNGSLDFAVLQSLPNVVGTDEIDRAELPTDGLDSIDRTGSDDDAVVTLAEPTTNRVPPSESADTADDRADDGAAAATGVDAATLPPPTPETTVYDWVLPEQGLPNAALPAPNRSVVIDEPAGTEQGGAASEPSASPPSAVDTTPERDAGPVAAVPPGATAPSETALLSPQASATTGQIGDQDISATIVDETTRKLLESLDCDGDEWHFCELVTLTTPYRKRNIEKLFGLTINTSESFTSQIIGRDLQLDILFPSFPAHLHIAYARRDGTIDHVMSSAEIWPADLSHRYTKSDQKIPGPPGLAMIVAIASDEPLFGASPNGSEAATAYLDRLKRRLGELEDQSPDGPIAASQLLIYVENAGT